MEKFYTKIADFVHTFQLENIKSEIAKGTQVSFALPQNLKYEINGETVEIGMGIVISHNDGKYVLNYKNEEITVKATDIYATKEQLESIKIQDSVSNTTKITIGNDNDMVNFRSRVLPSISDTDMELIEKELKRKFSKGDKVVLFVSTEKDDSTLFHLEGDKFLNATILTSKSS